MYFFKAGDYLIHVEKRLEEEQERLVYYLDSSTKKALIAAVEDQLIEAHVDSIIAKGLDKLLGQVLKYFIPLIDLFQNRKTIAINPASNSF